MPYFNLRPDFITVLLQNNLTRLQLSAIILKCVGIPDGSQHPEDENAVLFNVELTTLPFWSICKVVCDFHAKRNHCLYLSETI